MEKSFESATSTAYAIATAIDAVKGVRTSEEVRITKKGRKNPLTGVPTNEVLYSVGGFDILKCCAVRYVKGINPYHKVGAYLGQVGEVFFVYSYSASHSGVSKNTGVYYSREKAEEILERLCTNMVERVTSKAYVYEEVMFDAEDARIAAKHIKQFYVSRIEQARRNLRDFEDRISK